MKFIQMKTMISEMRNSVNKISRNLDTTKEKISELENRHC